MQGKRIAIGLGSRGIHAIDKVARAVVDQIKLAGGEPFIVPAMGSHGGATAQGQIEVLKSLGIDEESMRCPIRATMDTVILGQSSAHFGNIPAHLDRFVTEADGLILINRIKGHTSFQGPLESGLHKMLAIGLGKEAGAVLLHSHGPQGLRDYMPEVARVLLQKINWVAGFAMVEDGNHHLAELKALSKEELDEGEKQLLQVAKRLTPDLPLKNVDVLIVDVMGKNFSGTGMDTNVIGRLRIDGQSEPLTPQIKAILVLNLSTETHGNALGIGLADFTVKRVVQKIDWEITRKNVLTSGFIRRGFIPLVCENDETALQAALNYAFSEQPEKINSARIMRIRNTLELECVQVSENLLAELRLQPDFVSATPPEVLNFLQGELTDRLQ